MNTSDIPTFRQGVLMFLCAVTVLLLASECDSLKLFLLKQLLGGLLAIGIFVLSRVWKEKERKGD